MGNIRLYTIVFGFIFIFRILALGPWISQPLFTPSQLFFYSIVTKQTLSFPLDEEKSKVLAKDVFVYRLVIWLKELFIDGVSWIGMIGLSLKKEFFVPSFWKMWIFICILWQMGIIFWLSIDLSSFLVWLLLSAASPFLLWVYGWKKQWLQERYE